METKRYAVTGAFGYTGKYVTERLLAQGHEVICLTNSPQRPNPFGERVKAHAFNFDSPQLSEDSLRGIDVLINTYWVRFNHKTFHHSEAVENTKKMFSAAKNAGVKRIVHVSITNPSINSDLEYFKGKAELEAALAATELSYAIVRPAVIFGKEDILINNIAWVLRHLPVFGVYGTGEYKIQPIFVEDMADLLISESVKSENSVINAIGAETFTYKELVRTIGNIIGKNRKIIQVSPGFGYFVGNIISRLKGDQTITRPEIKGLMDNLLYVDTPPTGKTKLTEWLTAHKNTVGKVYANELSRRIDRKKAY
jgi:NADH dehydrogenase